MRAGEPRRRHQVAIRPLPWHPLLAGLDMITAVSGPTDTAMAGIAAWYGVHGTFDHLPFAPRGPADRAGPVRGRAAASSRKPTAGASLAEAGIDGRVRPGQPFAVGTRRHGAWPALPAAAVRAGQARAGARGASSTWRSICGGARRPSAAMSRVTLSAARLEPALRAGRVRARLLHAGAGHRGRLQGRRPTTAVRTTGASAGTIPSWRSLGRSTRTTAVLSAKDRALPLLDDVAASRPVRAAGRSRHDGREMPR